MRCLGVQESEGAISDQAHEAVAEGYGGAPSTRIAGGPAKGVLRCDPTSPAP